MFGIAIPFVLVRCWIWILWSKVSRENDDLVGRDSGGVLGNGGVQLATISLYRSSCVSQACGVIQIGFL